MTAQPLKGLKVLDFSKVLAGPICTQYLGDMGAEVIKVETLVRGDDTRTWPPFRDVEGGDAFGSPFLAVNRNKRSIAIDLSLPQGLELARSLAENADVMVESLGPGAAARLGIDAQALSKLNPRLICCSISGYGSTGPLRSRKGYDLMLQAFSGMLSITGAPGGAPARSPFSPVDQATGLHALIGILAALNERHLTGKGQAVEVSLFDTATSLLGYFLQNYWERGTEPQRPGSGHESLCPYDLFETADKPLFLGIANDALWQAFCRHAGLANCAADERFKFNGGRVAHRAEVMGAVQAALRTRGHEDWGRLLDDAGVPWAPMHSLGDLSHHPHTTESGMVFQYMHPVLGEVKGVSQPVRFAGERPPLRCPPPGLGQHTDQVLSELGLDEERIAALRAQHVIN